MPATLLATACRRCQAPLDLARRAALVPSPRAGLLLDVACETCGHRALYPAPGPLGHHARG